MLEVKSLAAGYGKSRVLEDVSFSMLPGKIMALIGANAAGKSTTLRTTMGLHPSLDGEILINDTAVQNLALVERLGCGLTLVPEGRQIFPELSVVENLQMGAFRRQDRDTLEPDFSQIFKLFPRLAERKTQAAGTMSGGEQQMVAIARGMLSNPKYLMLDEPTLGLAPIVINEIGEAIRQMAESGIAVLIAEQNAQFALSIADEAAILEGGEIRQSGAADALAENPKVAELYLGI